MATDNLGVLLEDRRFPGNLRLFTASVVGCRADVFPTTCPSSPSRRPTRPESRGCRSAQAWATRSDAVTDGGTELVVMSACRRDQPIPDADHVVVRAAGRDHLRSPGEL